MKKKESKKQINNYARYSGIAFQMIGTIALGAFGGIRIDDWLDLEFPVFTLILTVLAVLLAIYFSIKDHI